MWNTLFMRMLSPMVILLVLCAIFYVMLHYYAISTLEGVTSVAVMEKVMALRMIFSGAFCMLLGYMGVKLTGHVWPAMLVHTSVVLGLLLVDIPVMQMVQNWQLTLLILASVASLTGVAGGLTLGIFWLRMKYPRKRRRSSSS